LYANKLSKLDEVNNFLEKHTIKTDSKRNRKSTDLKQAENDSENKVQDGGVVQVVKHLVCKCEALSSNFNPTRNKTKQKAKLPKKSLLPDGITVNPTNIKELTLLKLFQNTGEEGTLPNAFCKATITPMPRPDRGIIRRTLENTVINVIHHTNKKRGKPT
jgi:hypothetical protein